MMERPLMTPDELKSLPKGTFIVMKTGYHPMKVKLRLFFKWGIEFEEPYVLQEQGNRQVYYAKKAELENAILVKYRPDILEQREQERQEIERARAAMEAKWNQDQEFVNPVDEQPPESYKPKKATAKKEAHPLGHHRPDDLYQQGEEYVEDDNQKQDIQKSRNDYKQLKNPPEEKPTEN